MASAKAAGVVRFGAFEFDLPTRELRKNRTRLRVPDQSLEILAMVLEQPGKLVTRESIQARLWPRGTVVDFEHGVNAAVKRLRQALSDSAVSPRYIETLPKRGYRFVAPVEGSSGFPIFQNYRVLGEIGRGGMGIVYQAEDLRLGRQVALKVLPPEIATDQRRRARLLPEARAASALNHPNIVTVHDVGVEGAHEFIVMELIAGKPLSDSIPSTGMPVRQAVDIATQIADALANAHAAEIIHGDLKPGNIMVTGDGQVKVLDFGLAKVTDGPLPQDGVSHALEGKTAQGAVMGTACYMSPEQAEGRPMDSRSDIFSFGTVLYEMVTGQQAFELGSSAATFAGKLREEPVAPSGLVSGVPPDLELVIGCCLRKDPTERYQRMEDVKAALSRLRRELDPNAQPTPKAAPVRRRRRALIALGAVLTVAAGGGVTWHRWSRVGPTTPDLGPVPLTSSGIADSPSFSADGNRVAFHWGGETGDSWGIYVQQIGSSGPPVRVSSGEAGQALDLSPAWSPDDRHIAFVRHEPGTPGLYLIPSLGGRERRIADIPSECNPSPMNAPVVPQGSGLSWTPDSKWLAMALRDSPESQFGIWLISADNGRRRRLTGPLPTGIGDNFPSVSPDGRTLAFVRWVKDYAGTLYALRLSKDFQPEGAAWRLTNLQYPFVSGIAWTGDSREIVYSADGGGGLLRLPIAGGRPPVQMPYARSGPAFPAIAVSRPRLAYVTTSQVSTDLWRLHTRTGEQKVLVRSNAAQVLPQYSPDGRRIVFQSSRSGHMGLWTCDGDGTQCVELTTLGRTVGGTPRWSPDGRWIAFDSRSEGQAEIYVISAGGGGATRMTVNPADDVIPSWSRDGRWIYFRSDRSGRNETWRMPAAGGAAKQVTRSGGGATFESADGKYLYYVKQDAGGGVYRMPAAGGEGIQILPRVWGWPYFDVTATAIYFAPDSRAIQRLDLAAGQVTTLLTPERLMRAGGITVSADDAYVVWSQPDVGRRDLMLVEGFR